ncbi:MAG: hypothetical protein ACREHG_10915, partial [Candidatus Saccharimonadales bacterium]
APDTLPQALPSASPVPRPVAKQFMELVLKPAPAQIISSPVPQAERQTPLLPPPPKLEPPLPSPPMPQKSPRVTFLEDVEQWTKENNNSLSPKV